MSFFASQIAVAATGATALVAPATTAYQTGQTTGAAPAMSVSRNARWRTVALNSTGAFFVGPNATGTSVTMALIPPSTLLTMPLAPDEGIYGLGLAGSTVYVAVSGA